MSAADRPGLGLEACHVLSPPSPQRSGWLLSIASLAHALDGEVFHDRDNDGVEVDGIVGATHGFAQFLQRAHPTGRQQNMARVAQRATAALETAVTIEDMDVPGFRLHPRVGHERGRWSIWVNGNWRLTFEFSDGNVHVLDDEDYH